MFAMTLHLIPRTVFEVFVHFPPHSYEESAERKMTIQYASFFPRV